MLQLIWNRSTVSKQHPASGDSVLKPCQLSKPSSEVWLWAEIHIHIYTQDQFANYTVGLQNVTGLKQARQPRYTIGFSAVMWQWHTLPSWHSKPVRLAITADSIQAGCFLATDTTVHTSQGRSPSSDSWPASADWHEAYCGVTQQHVELLATSSSVCLALSASVAEVSAELASQWRRYADTWHQSALETIHIQ